MGRVNIASVLSFLQQKESTKESAAFARSLRVAKVSSTLLRPATITDMAL
jgi:hypothetical protein